MAANNLSEQKLDLDNKEWQDALQIVDFTRRSLFLTGKAGTGKSTFLRYVVANSKKKSVVLAPTGIAAINAGGQTLHSFFKLPFHPLLPNDTRYDRRHIKETLKYTSAQRKLLRELELIATAGGRRLPVGAGAEGRRPPAAAALLSKCLFLQCQGVAADAAGQY